MGISASDKTENWDVIVAGSGLGGLSTAAYLCAAGKRTLVVEAHYVAGGNSQVFRRKRGDLEYEFDVGIHYIGECGREGSITRILRSLALEDRVSFCPLDSDAYSTLYFPDFTFRIPFGWDNYRRRLLESFPDEAASLTGVLDVMQAVAGGGRRLTNAEFQMDALASEAPDFLQWGLRPITDLFAEHGLSAQAAAVILGEQGCYAVRPSRTPVALAAGLADHFLRGAYYPEGGGQVIAARLVEAIRAWGGEVRTNTPVRRVRIENGRVAGVVVGKKSADPVEIDAPVVVSNADLKRTVFDLVGEEHFSPQTRERIRSLKMSLPLFCVYLGIDMDIAAHGLARGNHFLWGTYDIEGAYDKLESGRLAPENMVYLTAATMKDPGSRHTAPEGYTNLQIMTIAPREYGVWHVDKGPAEGGSYHRDAAYRGAKEDLADYLIAEAEKIVPGLGDHIAWKEAATPVTQERFTRSTCGTSYGIEMSLDQIGPLRVGPRTEIPGLFLCGASTPSGSGVAGVLRGGVAAASEVLENDLLAAVLGGQVLGDGDALPELSEDWDAWKASH